MNPQNKDEAVHSQHSTNMQPIYDKIQELKGYQNAKKEIQLKSQFIQVIEHVPKNELKLAIDRCEQFVKRKLKGQQIENQQPASTRGTGKVRLAEKQRQIRVRTKSDRVINFLKTHQDESNREKPKTPAFVESNIHDEREVQVFTPIRPISRMSRMSRYQQSITGTERSKRSSQNQSSSNGYSQIARLSSKTKSKKEGTPSKYLRKGHRMRETLLKQMAINDDINEESELAYLKQYDQWVPASLATYKKMELEHFMSILMGGKKVEQKKLQIFEPIYL